MDNIIENLNNPMVEKNIKKIYRYSTIKNLSEEEEKFLFLCFSKINLILAGNIENEEIRWDEYKYAIEIIKELETKIDIKKDLFIRNIIGTIKKMFALINNISISSLTKQINLLSNFNKSTKEAIEDKTSLKNAFNKIDSLYKTNKSVENKFILEKKNKIDAINSNEYLTFRNTELEKQSGYFKKFFPIYSELREMKEFGEKREETYKKLQLLKPELTNYPFTKFINNYKVQEWNKRNKLKLMKIHKHKKG